MSKENKNRKRSIEESILLLKEGKIEALETLYSLISKDVYAYALSKVNNKFDADDIMQDTFVRIYENAKLYEPQGNPMAWVITVEKNIINRFFQLRNRNDSIEDENIVANETSISERIVNNTFLNNLLKNLNEFEREVISLHVVSGLKFREIAKLLNKPLSTILSKYNRAIKKLQNLIKEDK